MLAFRAGRDRARQVLGCANPALPRLSVAGFAKKKEEAAGGRDTKTHRLLKVVPALLTRQSPTCNNYVDSRHIQHSPRPFSCESHSYTVG